MLVVLAAANRAAIRPTTAHPVHHGKPRAPHPRSLAASVIFQSESRDGDCRWQLLAFRSENASGRNAEASPTRLLEGQDHEQPPRGAASTYTTPLRKYQIFRVPNHVRRKRHHIPVKLLWSPSSDLQRQQELQDGMFSKATPGRTAGTSAGLCSTMFARSAFSPATGFVGRCEFVGGG